MSEPFVRVVTAADLPTDMQEELARRDIDPARIIDLNVKTDYHYMWRSPLPFPAGGTYEGEQREFGAKCVATRETVTLDLELFGSERKEGMTYARFTHDGQSVTGLTITVERPWVFTSDV